MRLYALRQQRLIYISQSIQRFVLRNELNQGDPILILLLGFFLLQVCSILSLTPNFPITVISKLSIHNVNSLVSTGCYRNTCTFTRFQKLKILVSNYTSNFQIQNHNVSGRNILKTKKRVNEEKNKKLLITFISRFILINNYVMVL